MIERDYFFGVPDLIAEVLSPGSWAMDYGPRRELYRRVGVPHLWILDPELETIEVHELKSRTYHQVGKFNVGEEFRPSLFEGETIVVSELFRTQIKRHGGARERLEPLPVPEWILPAELNLGLEYFFLLGHPDRRWEIWGNRAPAVLAFGSVAEARARFAHFFREACAWEGVLPTAPATLATDVEQAEAGRFKLRRSGSHVHLEVAVDGRKFRDLLKVFPKREAWDWGEK